MKRIKMLSIAKAVAYSLAARANDRLFDYGLRMGLILQVAPTTVQSLAGATLAISASIPATHDAAGYAASPMVYTLIGNVEDFGSHGVVSAVMKFTPVATAIVAKRKGSKDYGQMTLKIGRVPSDAGQVILRAASESPNPYSVKLVYPSGEIHYISALIGSMVNDDGSVDNIQRVTVQLELDQQPVIVAAT